MDKNQNTIRGILGSFVRDYRVKPAEMSPAAWLDGKFAEYPEIWESEAERRGQALEIVEGVSGFRESAKRLDRHLSEGKSAASFIGDAISRGCKAGGVSATGRYVAGIDSAIGEANRVMAEAVFVHNPDGTLDYSRVSQAPQLNGNIAEAHHAGTFNIDAAVKERSLLANMPASHGRNSVDLTVEDAEGHVVRRYQSKYGKDAEATQELFGNKYRGQRKLVPEEQSDKIPGATDRVEADGVSSRPLSKDKAVAMQKETQTSGKAHEYGWEEANMGVLMKSVGKKAAISGMFAIGFQGARILGRRAWNAITGRKNKPLKDDMAEFVESAAKSGVAATGTVAVAGGIMVAARKGLLGAALKSARGNVIGNAVCVAVENIKILHKVGTGEITGREALDRAGRTNAALVGSLALGAKGAAVGASIGAALGPVGAAVGGVVGGIAGGIAGSTVGEALYEGAKKVCRTVCSVASSVARGIGRGVSSLCRALNPLNWL